MKLFSPVLLFFVVLILMVSAGLALRSALFSTNGFDSGNSTISGIQQPVVLNRTESGMVRIKSDHEADFEAALGYTHARDRLWQLEKMHRAVNSTHSVFTDESFMRADLLTRILLETGGQTRQTFFGFTDDDMSRFSRYAAGINAFIDDAGRDIPLQFTISGATPSRWTADDVAGAFVLQLWLLETSWQQPLANLKASKLLPPGLAPVLFGLEAYAAFSSYDTSPAFLEQVSELLLADDQLRLVLNAPRQIQPVRSVAEWDTDGSASVLITFQSGPDTPGFWYDTAIIGAASPAGETRAFTLPGTPALWAGARTGYSWHPVQSSELADILVPAPGPAVPARISIRTAQGGSTLFRPFLTPDAFLLLPDQRASFAFARLNASAGSAFRGFPKPGTSTAETAVDPQNRHLLIIPHATPAPASDPNQIQLQFSGLRPTVQETLAEQRFFTDNRLLSFQNHELLVTHRGRQKFAHSLSEIFQGYSSVPSIAMAAEYLSNWDGQYNRYLTAATLTEFTLIKTAENALASYLEPEVVKVFRSLNLIDPEIGIFLLDAHLTAQGRASPVSDQFFARRVQEALFELESAFGPEPYEWRWGNVNRNTFSDAALCAGPLKTTFIRRRACLTLETVNTISVLGQRDLVNAAVVFLREGNVETRTFTTALLQTGISPAGSVSHVSVLVPGYADNPFSPWFDSGMTAWPYFERFTPIPSQSVRSAKTLRPVPS